MTTLWPRGKCIALLAFLCLLVACGDGDGDSSGGSPPLPGPNDAQFGTAGNVLAADRSAATGGTPVELWIGFANAERWQTYLELHAREANGRIPFVGGRVVVDSNRDLGFYFDPTTVEAVEVAAGGVVTTLDALSRDPARAAADGHAWFVAIDARTIVPSSVGASTRSGERGVSLAAQARRDSEV